MVSEATTSVLLSLPGTIRITTTTTTYDTTAVAVDGAADRVVAMIMACGDGGRDTRFDGCMSDRPRASLFFFGYKPSAS